MQMQWCVEAVVGRLGPKANDLKFWLEITMMTRETAQSKKGIRAIHKAMTYFPSDNFFSESVPTHASPGYIEQLPLTRGQLH